MRKQLWLFAFLQLAACANPTVVVPTPTPGLLFPPAPAVEVASPVYAAASEPIGDRTYYPIAPTTPTTTAPVPTYGAFGRYLSPPATSHSSTSSSRVYTGNCPTPDSYDAAGRRCGARSAASRPGGYDGYGSWSSGRSYGGTTYVRGHMRNGRWVSGYTRRSRR